MAPLTFGISHLMSPAEISAFPLNQPTARNDMPLGLLSPRAGTASPRTISAATAVLPAGLHLVILMTLLPPLQPRRLHASELISHLLGRKLHQPRPPDRRPPPARPPPPPRPCACSRRLPRERGRPPRARATPRAAPRASRTARRRESRRT